MIKSSPVELEMDFAHQAMGSDKFWIAPHCLLQQRDGLKQTSLRIRIICQVAQLRGAQKKVVSDQVASRRAVDLGFFSGRQMCLQLLCDCLRDFALNSEYISPVAIIGLRPEMRVGTRVNELGIHSNFARDALHAAFEQMGHAEFFPNLP